MAICKHHIFDGRLSAVNSGFSFYFIEEIIGRKTIADFRRISLSPLLLLHYELLVQSMLNYFKKIR